MKKEKTCTYPQALWALDAIADAVLAYKPKPKTKAAKKRVRKAKKDAQNS